MRILLDVDGVVLDFNSAAKRASFISDHEEPTFWNWFEGYGISEKEFWDNVKLCGADFYGEMVEKYPWTDELVSLVRSYGELTFVTNGPTFVDGKIQRLSSDYPDAHIILMNRSDKHLLAASDRVLIDDKRENICEFVDTGGRGILFPQPWNGNGKYFRDRMAYVRHRLQIVYANELIS